MLCLISRQHDFRGWGHFCCRTGLFLYASCSVRLYLFLLQTEATSLCATRTTSISRLSMPCPRHSDHLYPCTPIRPNSWAKSIAKPDSMMTGHLTRKASFPFSSTSPALRLPRQTSHTVSGQFGGLRSSRQGVPSTSPHLHTPPIPMQHIEFDVAFYPQRICRITRFPTRPDPQHCRNAGRHASHGMLRVAENPMRAAYPPHALDPRYSPSKPAGVLTDFTGQTIVATARRRLVFSFINIDMHKISTGRSLIIDINI